VPSAIQAHAHSTTECTPGYAKRWIPVWRATDGTTSRFGQARGREARSDEVEIIVGLEAHRGVTGAQLGPNANLQGINVVDLWVSDSAHDISRFEVHFRINGELFVLQMGNQAEGSGEARWATGINGEGTSIPQLVHPTTGTWIATARAGSMARLWSVKDRAHPVDRGLYVFPFKLRFVDFPMGALHPCLNPETSYMHQGIC